MTAEDWDALNRLWAEIAEAGVPKADWPYLQDSPQAVLKTAAHHNEWKRVRDAAGVDAGVRERLRLERELWAADSRNPDPRPAAGEEVRPGPRPMTSAAEVSAKRAELAASGPSGERSIAKALGVSRDAVRYAQGKDRRPPR